MKRLALILVLSAGAMPLSHAGADSDAAVDARQRIDCALTKTAGMSPEAAKPRGYMDSEAADYDSPSGSYSACTEREYAEFKTVFDPAGLLRNAPTAAGARSPGQERAQAIREMQRARLAGELSWSDFELGLPMRMAR